MYTHRANSTLTSLPIDRMMPDVYKAAVQGKPQDYYHAIKQTTGGEELGRQLTPIGNTVLHLAALHHRKHFVENILKTEKDHTIALAMLHARNEKYETVLHCAAEKGCADIVSFLITFVSDIKYEDPELGVGVTKMIRMKDNVGDTALHKAVRMGHLEVVKLLVKEDDDFEYPLNDAGETPIYLAAEFQFLDCLIELLNTCKHPTYDGPMGRNALHAAILTTGIKKMPYLWEQIFRTFSIHYVKISPTGSSECTKALLEKEISLCERTDDFGWTPLHYAVKFRQDETVSKILEERSNVAYFRAGRGDEWTTIFHIAAIEDNIEMMKAIASKCPDCWEMINSKGQNVLHQVVLSEKVNVIKYLFECPQIEELVGKKDEDGNTPLHLLANSLRISSYIIKRHHIQKHLVFNKEHRTPLDIALEFKPRTPAGKLFRLGRQLVLSDGKTGCRGDFSENSEKVKNTDRKDEDIKRMVESSQANSIVATLILTTTFAAGFTIPGGYNSDHGKPILLKNNAFKVFVGADILAFICSIWSIFLHIAVISEASSSSRKNYMTIRSKFLAEKIFTSYATVGVIIAFFSGIYATLSSILVLSELIVSVCFIFGMLAYNISYNA